MRTLLLLPLLRESNAAPTLIQTPFLLGLNMLVKPLSVFNTYPSLFTEFHSESTNPIMSGTDLPQKFPMGSGIHHMRYQVKQQ